MSRIDDVIRACTVSKNLKHNTFVFSAWLFVKKFDTIDDKMTELARVLPPEILPVLSAKAQSVLNFLGEGTGLIQGPLASDPNDNLEVPREFIEALVRIGEYRNDNVRTCPANKSTGCASEKRAGANVPEA